MTISILHGYEYKVKLLHVGLKTILVTCSRSNLKNVAFDNYKYMCILTFG